MSLFSHKIRFLSCLPVFAFSFKDYQILLKALRDVSNIVDSVGWVSKVFYFDSIQHYYSREMGIDILKVFTYFKTVVPKDELYKLKLLSLELENKYRNENKRQVNIDPGYIDEANLVLFSSKGRAARIYIKDKVFSELEYVFLNNEFMDMFWTYEDYKHKEVKEFFKEARKMYLKLRKI